MKLNTNYIIGGVLVGGGLYYAYSKGWFKKKPELKSQALENSQETINDIKAEQKAVAVEKAKAVVKEQVKKAVTTSLANPNSLESKVKKLQTLLKVGTDIKTYANPNSATNKALAATYGLDKGVVSALNVDYYIKKVQSNNTLVAQKLAAQKKQAVQNKTINDAKKFLELVNNGKYQATLTKDVTANAFVFDKLKNSFVDIKEPKKFSKGSVFSYGQFRKIPRNGYVMYYNQGNPTSLKLYALNPNDFLVTI